MVQDSDVASDR